MGAVRDNLRTPPPLEPGTLRLTPLGGLGDVGRNATVFELDGRLLLVDCGVLFPDDGHPGVDMLLPGLHVIADRLDDVDALVLTHGHEDHIGAVPYLLRRRPDIPILGTRLTLALVREKLKEHRLRQVDLRIIGDGERTTVGAFDLEFLPVNHSIPDAVAVVLRTAAGTVLHSGDFKMDQLPLDGRLTDLRGFARVGEEGVDLLLVDSTNAEVPGFTTSEIDVHPALERVFAKAPRKIIVACFSSHIHRVQQVLDEAHRAGRKVCYVGRSMVRNMTIAAELGYLKVPGGTLIALDELDHYPDDRVVIVSTGSQGEPLSALSRIASREHPVIKAGEGDVVLLASSLIPGNENSVSRVINGLTRSGVQVVHKGNALVHVTGHACAGELLYVYNIVKPRHVLPVHGELRQLRANADLAIATGVDPGNVLIIEDGGVVDLRAGRARVVGKVEAGYIFVDGLSVGEVGDAELDQRRILGEEGFISVIAAVNFHSMELVTQPQITARGVFGGDAAFDEITAELTDAILAALADGAEDTYELQQLIRRRIGRWVSRTHRRRPMIVPVVIAT